ncbi:uncharacterized protein LOC134293734 isoform X2 [Anolis carolinensis]|uniref:uncharacterized protein LOC134293734 isoform X2 n=1 Tax=Anolis carolinensis TaxID=28377 RepID=UPI002F2B8768
MWALSSGCGTSWLSLFLAAQIWSSCFLVAHSQATKNVTISIAVTPEYPLIGDSVTLIPVTTAMDVISCLWLKSFDSEYHEIFLHKIKPDNKVVMGDGYDGRQILRSNCTMRITQLKTEDMTLYVLIRNTTGVTEIGKTFLRILEDTNTPSPDPDAGEPKVITLGNMAGIGVACLIVSLLIVGLIMYRTMKQPEGLGSGEGRSPHSSSNLGSGGRRSPHTPSKPGSQPRLSMHTPGPGPAPQ